MFRLNGNYTLENGDQLINPVWEYMYAIDKVQEMKLTAYVRFHSEGYVTSDRPVLLDHDYSGQGTYEDTDIINAILALPEFCSSTEIE